MDQNPAWLPPQSPQTDPPAPAPSIYEQREPWYKRFFAPLVVAGALLLKFGKVALVGLKGAKFLTTSASMLVSIAAYTFLFGLKFAVGFVALLFVHEMGHYIQLRREGIKPEGMWFIPFLGAAVMTRSLGGNALAEARVGLAGPILGSIGVAVVWAVALALDSDWLQALAFTGFFLNLFNLLPVLPLDGGRAMAAMAPWMWFVGFFAIVLMVFVFPNPVIVLIALIGGFETYRRWKARKSGEEGNEAYYRVAPRARLLVGAVYIGLIALLVLGMDASYLERDFDDV